MLYGVFGLIIFLALFDDTIRALIFMSKVYDFLLGLYLLVTLCTGHYVLFVLGFVFNFLVYKKIFDTFCR